MRTFFLLLSSLLSFLSVSAQSPEKVFSALPRQSVVLQARSSSTAIAATTSRGIFLFSAGGCAEYVRLLKGPFQAGARVAVQRINQDENTSAYLPGLRGWCVPADLFLRTRLLSFGKKARVQVLLTTGVSVNVTRYSYTDYTNMQERWTSVGGLAGLQTVICLTQRWGIVLGYDWNILYTPRMQYGDWGLINNNGDLGIRYALNHK